MDGFIVIDNKTGTIPDVEEIETTEDWAGNLCYCDIEGFAITEDGSLILIDECGRYAYCPSDRFTVAQVEGGIFDKEEIYPDCTVQVLTNTQTGDVSVDGGEMTNEKNFQFARLLDMKDFGEINRVLGIIEGLAYGVQDSGIADGLVTAVERIEAVLDKGEEDGN